MTPPSPVEAARRPYPPPGAAGEPPAELRARVTAALLRLSDGRTDTGATARHLLGVLEEDGLVGQGSRDDSPMRAAVLAECVADVLPPLEGAALAVHSDIALPAMGALLAGAEDDPRPAAPGGGIVAFPLSTAPSRIESEPVSGGVRLSGVHTGFVMGEGTDTFLVPLDTAAPEAGSPDRRAALVDGAAEGVRIIPPTAQRPTGGVELAGVRVPANRVLTVPGECVVAARVWLAAYEVAAARNLIERTRRYAASRRSMGATLWDRQSVQFRIADLAARADGVRQLVHSVMDHRAGQERGEAALPSAGLVASAELRASRLLREVSADCLHLHGAHGHVDAPVLEQALTGSRVLAAVRGVDRSARSAIAREWGWPDE